MVILNSITITKSNRLKKLPWTIDCLRDLNVLVGPNGCGKTTIMGSLIDITKVEYDKKYHTTSTFERNMDYTGPISLYGLFYKDLVNTKQNFDEYESGLYGLYDIENSWKSAGERSLIQLKDFVGSGNLKNGLIFIDEMDASLDWNKQYKYCEYIKKLSKYNQVFVATHSLIVCESVGTMYDVSQRKWITYNELKDKYLNIKV